MNKILTLIIFLSVILFSCSKSTEDKIIGTWKEEGSDLNHTITFNADKTVIMSSEYGERIGGWKFNEATMEIYLGESSENPVECAAVISVDENNLCIEDQGETICMNKYK